MIKKTDKNAARKKKHDRLRNHFSGTAEVPRLNVYKSLNNIYAQVIDDTKGNTIVSASTLDQSLKGKLKYGGNMEACQRSRYIGCKESSGKRHKKCCFRQRRICISRKDQSACRCGKSSRSGILIGGTGFNEKRF